MAWERDDAVVRSDDGESRVVARLAILTTLLFGLGGFDRRALGHARRVVRVAAIGSDDGSIRGRRLEPSEAVDRRAGADP